MKRFEPIPDSASPSLIEATLMHRNAAMQDRAFTTAEQSTFDQLMTRVPSEKAVGARGLSIVVGHNRAEDKPWANAGEFLHAVRTTVVTKGAVTDPRIAASAALGASETIDTDGGILVPPQLSNQLLQKTYDTGAVTSRCDTIPMGGPRLQLPRVDETSRKDGQRYGGIQVYREQEAGQYTASKSKLDYLELNANKMLGLTYLTEELTEDVNAQALDQWIFKMFPQAFSFRMDTEVFSGTGAGEFLGLNTSNAVVVVAKDLNQAAATITTTNVLNIYARLWGPSRLNSVWFVNQDVEAQLMQLTLGSGTAVELLYLPVGFRGNNGPYATLMGRPVVPIEQAEGLGTQGDIGLYDMSEYIIGQRSSGIRADTSIHVAFTTGQQAFRWMIRNDGQPKWKAPLVPYNGANTLSPFVQLASRH